MGGAHPRAAGMIHRRTDGRRSLGKPCQAQIDRARQFPIAE
jgi:hypothetical protein